jgi:hypothetical protein
MYQDYKDLLSAFHAHGVKYLAFSEVCIGGDGSARLGFVISHP